MPRRSNSAAFCISIPAPARGRTMPRRSNSAAFCISIPAPARGRTFTLIGAVQVSGYFNSRPREGANVFLAGHVDEGHISIPAPARGRTDVNGGALTLDGISIPAPARGRTGRTEHQRLHRPDFNSRPREGANGKTAQNRAVYLVSLLKFGRISAILPYILSATRAKKRETPKIIGFLLRRPTGRSCAEQVGAGGVR